jgi:hypothetical protein
MGNTYPGRARSIRSTSGALGCCLALLALPAACGNLARQPGISGADGPLDAGGADGQALGGGLGVDSPSETFPDVIIAQPHVRPVGDDGPRANEGSSVLHGFESGLDGWTDIRWDNPIYTRPAPTVLAQVDTRHEIPGKPYQPTIGFQRLAVPALQRLVPGMRLRYHVLIPSKAGLTGVLPFIVAFSKHVPNDPPWFPLGDPVKNLAAITEGQWHEIEHVIHPDVVPNGVIEVALEFRTKGPQTVDAFVDLATF